MGFKTNKINFRVEVYSDTYRSRTMTDEEFEKECAKDCRSIEAEIKRHVDNGGVVVKYDTEKNCEHCGYAWTEESTVYNGGCCDKDEENNPNPTT